MNFNKLALAPEIISNLESLGYLSMTPIQEKSLPFILEGKDVIGQAKTGSGKTAAFGLGLLSRLDVRILEPQSLVLCPTRELAEQVTNELRRLARFTNNVKILALCGGTDEKHQKKSLTHGVQMFVWTSCMFFKLLKDKVIKLNYLEMFVLDEADRMLDMGFHDDILRIEGYTPTEKQTLLFSATFPAEIEDLSSDFQQNPELIQVDMTHGQDEIKQHFYQLDSHKDKNNTVMSILGKFQPESTVIFCKTKLICDALVKDLQKRGVDALALHGDHDQRERTLVLTKFSNNSCLVLVATDVAARGLDINDLQLVINYDISPDPEIYVHRIGRTGREGKGGLAVSLSVAEEQYKIDDISSYLEFKVKYDDVASLDPELEYTVEPAMKTLYISGGRKDKIRPGDIVGAILGTSQVKAECIGDINILNVFSYVAIKSEFADEVVTGLQNGKIKKRNFKIGFA